MNKVPFSSINLLDVGNTVCLTGSVWTGNDGKSFILPFPEFSLEELGEISCVEPTLEEWKTFLTQSDLVETEVLVNDNGNLKKAILRKTQRLIDNRIQWNVFKRDNYTCRYTGETSVPLTVDHIDLWENGGASVEENLLSTSRKANKLRGNMPYDQWIHSDVYKKISRNLPESVKQANEAIVANLPHLESLRRIHQMSR